jgi:hypothetical protein
VKLPHPVKPGDDVLLLQAPLWRISIRDTSGSPPASPASGGGAIGARQPLLPAVVVAQAIDTPAIAVDAKTINAMKPRLKPIFSSP